MTVEMIFFDNDGVLVDTESYYFQANQEEMAALGIAMTLEDYREYFLKRSLGIFHWFPEKSPEWIAAFRRRRSERHQALLATSPIAVPGVEAVLRSLSGHCKMGVVTSSERRPFTIIHERTGFLPYFDFVIGREDVTASKPDPEPYRKALARSGMDPAACLVIEDSERGLKSAIAAGLRCWVIPNELTRTGDFSGADRILSDIRDLPDLLLESGA